MNQAIVERVDHWLQTTIGDRTILGVGEVRDMLLDIRLLATVEDAEPELVGAAN